jgi:hypothetical protein
MLPEVIRAVEVLIAIALAHPVHRLDVVEQGIVVGDAVRPPRDAASAEAAQVPDGAAVARLGAVREQRVLGERLARPVVRLDVDRVDVPLGLGRALEALLALRARVRFLGFMEAGAAC